MDFVECSNCHAYFQPNEKKCPCCGSGNRVVVVRDSLTLTDTIPWLERIVNDPAYKKNWKLQFVENGEEVGRDGRLARITLIIDKENNLKYHLIMKKDEDGKWKITHFHDDPLDESKEFGDSVGKRIK